MYDTTNVNVFYNDIVLYYYNLYSDSTNLCHHVSVHLWRSWSEENSEVTSAGRYYCNLPQLRANQVCQQVSSPSAATRLYAATEHIRKLYKRVAPATGCLSREREN